MSRLDETLASIAPGVATHLEYPGRYNPRRGLAIYSLPIPGYSPSAPGVVLGEALAARSGLGCSLLEGIPVKLPEGAAVIGRYSALKLTRPDLLADIPEPTEPGQYAIKLDRNALVTASSIDGLAAGMQTLAMLVLRHGEPTLPGAVIVDQPQCRGRGIALELQQGEITLNLLMHILSFAATFKANQLHLALSGDFAPDFEVAGIDSFYQTCTSFGVTPIVRLPWLGKILSGEKTLVETWSGIRAAARIFGATQAALDDPCPPDVDPEAAARIVASVMRGEVGLAGMSVDWRLIEAGGYANADLKSLGITGWHRHTGGESLPDASPAAATIMLDVPAPATGFTSRSLADFHARLDAAGRWLDGQPQRELLVSFRDIGVSHMWQNLMYPAATGLIAAWGKPPAAVDGALRYAELLYGDAGDTVMRLWEAVERTFPPGLDAAQEKLIRRIAFGHWPEDEDEEAVLTSIDWLEVVKNIHAAAEAIKDVAERLNRNLATLSGASMSLHSLSWLHCFAALMPELRRRRRVGYDEDGRTEPIAAELSNTFSAWFGYLTTVRQESGMEISEMPRLEAMGLRIKGLCEAIFE